MPPIEGNSLVSAVQIAGASISTVTRLLEEVGEA